MIINTLLGHKRVCKKEKVRMDEGEERKTWLAAKDFSEKMIIGTSKEKLF
jgi:hypothetical protein